MTLNTRSKKSTKEILEWNVNYSYSNLVWDVKAVLLSVFSSDQINSSMNYLYNTLSPDLQVEFLYLMADILRFIYVKYNWNRWLTREEMVSQFLWVDIPMDFEVYDIRPPMRVYVPMASLEQAMPDLASTMFSLWKPQMMQLLMELEDWVFWVISIKSLIEDYVLFIEQTLQYSGSNLLQWSFAKTRIMESICEVLSSTKLIHWKLNAIYLYQQIFQELELFSIMTYEKILFLAVNDESTLVREKSIEILHFCYDVLKDKCNFVSVIERNFSEDQQKNLWEILTSQGNVIVTNKNTTDKSVFDKQFFIDSLKNTSKIKDHDKQTAEIYKCYDYLYKYIPANLMSEFVKLWWPEELIAWVEKNF